MLASGALKALEAAVGTDEIVAAICLQPHCRHSSRQMVMRVCRLFFFFTFFSANPQWPNVQMMEN